LLCHTQTHPVVKNKEIVMPVILTTQEAQIRRILGKPPGEIVFGTLSQKYQTQKGLVE
jgi:hypothetical protein